MINSEIMSFLADTSMQDVLVRLYKIEPVQKINGEYYLQCYLLPVSDESDALNEITAFWDKSFVDGHFCYAVTGEFLSTHCDEFFSNDDDEAKTLEHAQGLRVTLERQLKDKILRINPYFSLDKASKSFFYRNPNFYKQIEIISAEFECESFFKIPVLNEKNYELLKEHKTISLLNWNFATFGVPNFLIYKNHLISLKLTTSKVSEYNCSWKEGDDYLELEFDYESFKAHYLYIQREEDSYAFLEKATLPFMKEVELEKKADETEDRTEMEPLKPDETKEALGQFENYLKGKKLYYYEEDIQNFHACLKSRILTILAGMSGTGKTRLPLEYAQFFNMTEENQRLLFLSVSPSYNEPSDILGFYNPSDNTYVPSETGLVTFLNHAYKNPKQMHMVIFDEMNLSQIEYYFAPFLSVMEKDSDHRFITLYDENLECKNKDKYPSKIKILDNLLFVGTINLDETTKDLSDRLLDRSFILSLKKTTFDRFNAVMVSSEEGEVKPYGGDYRRLMGEVSSSFCFNDCITAEMREFFDSFDLLLSKNDPQRGISFRTVKNIAIYLKNSKIDENDSSSDFIFDYALKQTAMRKLRGTYESVIDLVGTIDEKGEVENSSVYNLFEQYKSVSSFESCKQILKNKAVELKKYGYCR